MSTKGLHFRPVSTPGAQSPADRHAFAIFDKYYSMASKSAPYGPGAPVALAQRHATREANKLGWWAF